MCNSAALQLLCSTLAALALAGCGPALGAGGIGTPATPPAATRPLAAARPSAAPIPTAAPAPTQHTLPSPTQPPAATTSPTAAPTPTQQPTPAPVAHLPFGYPIGYSGRAPGDGFYIRHGFTTENTWYNPGFWHTGEDWYALGGETGGAPVLAVADGRVVYAGSNYPGRVVIVEHAPPAGGSLFSMYGHLDFALAVGENDQVARGQPLGTVLLRDDGVPSHLHFEVRDFLLRDEVNGDAPRYDFRCGPRCPPGPGYWPIEAPEHPTALGWRVPAHILLAAPNSAPAQVVVAEQPLTPATPLYSGPPDANPQPLGRELSLAPGGRYDLLAVWSGPADGQGTSAQAYQVWYQLALPNGSSGWAQALRPWDYETGSDGRPSSIRVDLLPVES